jgi:tRNA splicing ligase
MPHTFDARIAKSHQCINEAAELISDLLADRKRLHATIVRLQEANASLERLIASLTKEDAA